MAFRDMFKATEYKQRVEELESMLTPEMADADRLRREAEDLRKKIEEEKASLEKLEKQNFKLDAIVKAKVSKSRVLDDELLVEEFGLYRPRFDFADSTHYKDALDRCRRKQKEAVKSFSKAADKTSWTVNGSASKGKAMVREISRLLMMAYNGECDEIVRKVKATNVERSLERIEKSAAAINRNGKTIGISIPAAYVLLKQEEVQLAFEFAQEKEEEKEALREAREQEREARKLEAALHRAFEDRKVNIVNQRREFFRVSLDEIEEVVKANYDKTVEFHSVPDAEQYRTSEKLREKGIFHPLA